MRKEFHGETPLSFEHDEFECSDSSESFDLVRDISLSPFEGSWMNVSDVSMKPSSTLRRPGGECTSVLEPVDEASTSVWLSVIDSDGSGNVSFQKAPFVAKFVSEYQVL
jgi:hypothetical protein